MSAIIAFESGAVPARAMGRRSLSADVATGGDYPVLSIQGGKAFSVVSGGVRQIMTKPDDPEEPLRALDLVVIRANSKSRTYYGQAYDPDADAVKPDCFSYDGVSPDSTVETPCSPKCAVCPNARFGTAHQGKGMACREYTRLAVAHPADLTKQYLLRVPYTSLRDKATNTGFRDVVQLVKQRGMEYNEIVYRVALDIASTAPQMHFKPKAILDDAAYQVCLSLYDDAAVGDIVGTPSQVAAPSVPAPAPQAAPVARQPRAAQPASNGFAGTMTEDARELRAAVPGAEAIPEEAFAEMSAELDDMMGAESLPATAAATAAPRKSASKPRSPKPAAAPVAPAAAPAPQVAPAPAAPVNGGPDLLADMDSLLGGYDD